MQELLLHFKEMMSSLQKSFRVESDRSASGALVGHHPVDDLHISSVGSFDPAAGNGQSFAIGGRPTLPLPPDASNTLFVEGLPGNCSRWEVSHIFRPFVGFKEVRLVNKEVRHSGGDPLVLCFVDFGTPTAAALSYGLNNKEGLIAVFDPGGGTFSQCLPNL